MEGNTFSPEITYTNITTLRPYSYLKYDCWLQQIKPYSNGTKSQLLYLSFVHVDSNSFTKSKRVHEQMKFQTKLNNDVWFYCRYLVRNWNILIAIIILSDITTLRHYPINRMKMRFSSRIIISRCLRKILLMVELQFGFVFTKKECLLY